MTGRCDVTIESSSIGLRAWAAEGGGAELVWERGAGDARMRGWARHDGERAIETNGDPIWEGEDGFEELWGGLFRITQAFTNLATAIELEAALRPVA